MMGMFILLFFVCHIEISQIMVPSTMHLVPLERNLNY
jgi:hypothetical protein